MVIGKNGTTLKILPERLSNAAASLIESLKINSVSEKTIRHRSGVVKRRNAHSEQIAEMANLYFGWTGLPIRFWSKVEENRGFRLKNRFLPNYCNPLNRQRLTHSNIAID